MWLLLLTAPPLSLRYSPQLINISFLLPLLRASNSPRAVRLHSPQTGSCASQAQSSLVALGTRDIRPCWFRQRQQQRLTSCTEAIRNRRNSNKDLIDSNDTSSGNGIMAERLVHRNIQVTSPPTLILVMHRCRLIVKATGTWEQTRRQKLQQWQSE